MPPKDSTAFSYLKKRFCPHSVAGFVETLYVSVGNKSRAVVLAPTWITQGSQEVVWFQALDLQCDREHKTVA